MAEGDVLGEIVNAECGFVIDDVRVSLDEVMDDACFADRGIAK